MEADGILGIELDYLYSSENEPHYAVSAHVDDSRQLVLLMGLNSKQAEYIAWQLANALAVPLSNNSTMPG